jgi:lipoate-protein ligase A
MTKKQQWRLIPLLEASGIEQMAIDRWLFEQYRLGKQPPTLRFYTWDPIAISLGYHQKRYPPHWDNLTYQGVPMDLVYRPTGGRAVLHQGDLTYMVVTSGLSGTRGEVYQQICQFLIQGWRTLGVELTYGKAGRGYIHNPNCFATATSADLIDPQGNKLIGSAQLRQGEFILQHGSMKLNPAQELWRQVFPNDHSILKKRSFSNLEIMESLTHSAESCFTMQLREEPLSQEEWREIKDSISKNYCQKP